jgi:hypothetical protein
MGMAPSQTLRLLSLVDFFEPLSTEEIEELNGQPSDLHLEPGEICYSPSPATELPILPSGSTSTALVHGQATFSATDRCS